MARNKNRGLRPKRNITGSLKAVRAVVETKLYDAYIKTNPKNLLSKEEYIKRYKQFKENEFIDKLREVMVALRERLGEIPEGEYSEMRIKAINLLKKIKEINEVIDEILGEGHQSSNNGLTNEDIQFIGNYEI